MLSRRRLRMDYFSALSSALPSQVVVCEWILLAGKWQRRIQAYKKNEKRETEPTTYRGHDAVEEQRRT